MVYTHISITRAKFESNILSDMEDIKDFQNYEVSNCRLF